MTTTQACVHSSPLEDDAYKGQLVISMGTRVQLPSKSQKPKTLGYMRCREFQGVVVILPRRKSHESINRTVQQSVGRDVRT